MVPATSGMRVTVTGMVRSGPPTRTATLTGIGLGVADAGCRQSEFDAAVQLWWRPSSTCHGPFAPPVTAKPVRLAIEVDVSMRVPRMSAYVRRTQYEARGVDLSLSSSPPSVPDEQSMTLAKGQQLVLALSTPAASMDAR